MVSEDFLFGLLTGLTIGIVVGAFLFKSLSEPRPSSIIFERDKSGKIVEIHYIPGVKKT